MYDIVYDRAQICNVDRLYIYIYNGLDVQLIYTLNDFCH